MPAAARAATTSDLIALISRLLVSFLIMRIIRRGSAGTIDARQPGNAAAPRPDDISDRKN
jgi:hypothetical protein